MDGYVNKDNFLNHQKKRFCLLLSKTIEIFRNKNKGKTTDDYNCCYKYYAKKNNVLELNKNRAKDRKIYYSFKLLYFKDGALVN